MGNSVHKTHKSPPEVTGRRRRDDRTVPSVFGVMNQGISAIVYVGSSTNGQSYFY